jgi:phosphoglycolate phosphatase
LLLIFDLDGTLIDSSEDLATAMNATREHFGMPPLDPKLIYSYVGWGAAVLVRHALGPGAPEDMIREASDFLIAFYHRHALEHTKLYPGIRETIEKLSAAGQTLAVLTNKPAAISQQIICALGVNEHFTRIYGGDSFSKKKPDPVGITTLMTELDVPQPATLMIGDSSVDVQTGRNAAVRTCGVGWGFQPGSFEEYPPDVIIQHPYELIKHVNGNNVTG